MRCVAPVDDNLGRLLGYLDESGLADNTVIVYTSDQGFYLGDHGWFGKGCMYEESLRVPLIIRWPGVTKPGSENQTQSSLPLKAYAEDQTVVSFRGASAGKVLNDGKLQGQFHRPAFCNEL